MDPRPYMQKVLDAMQAEFAPYWEADSELGQRRSKPPVGVIQRGAFGQSIGSAFRRAKWFEGRVMGKDAEKMDSRWVAPARYPRGERYSLAEYPYSSQPAKSRELLDKAYRRFMERNPNLWWRREWKKMWALSSFLMPIQSGLQRQAVMGYRSYGGTVRETELLSELYSSVRDHCAVFRDIDANRAVLVSMPYSYYPDAGGWSPQNVEGVEQQLASVTAAHWETDQAKHCDEGEKLVAHWGKPEDSFYGHGSGLLVVCSSRVNIKL